MYIFEPIKKKIYIYYLQTNTYNFCESINKPVSTVYRGPLYLLYLNFWAYLSAYFRIYLAIVWYIFVYFLKLKVSKSNNNSLCVVLIC
jgi:hypothetical protein